MGDYRDVVGNNIVKPHNYINAQRKLKDKYILQPLVVISNVLQKSNISTADQNNNKILFIQIRHRVCETIRDA